MKRRNENIDYDISNLPVTRKEALKDVYKHNFKTIISSGVSLLLFSLPLIIFLVVMNIARLGIIAEKFDENTLSSVLLVWDLILNGGVILFLYVVLIGVMGVMRIIKLLVWQEGINFIHDFKVGIKENLLYMSLFYVFGSLIYLLTYLVYTFILNFILGIALLLLFIIIFVPIIYWGFFTINVYQTSLGNYLKNAAFFYFRALPLSLLFVIVSLVPFFFIFLPINGFIFFIKYPLLILLIIFFYPFLIIVGYLYSLSLFDEYINKDNYPEIYRKGLYDIKEK